MNFKKTIWIILTGIGVTGVYIADNTASFFPPKTPAYSGKARVSDGDTLTINGHRIRLQGIDAPETRQQCTVKGKPHLCGITARDRLAEYINGKTVQCTHEGTDRYQRPLAYCWLGNRSINSWMIHNGLALAYTEYSYRYFPEELYARFKKIGIHAGEYEFPWQWRKLRKNR